MDSINLLNKHLDYFDHWLGSEYCDSLFSELQKDVPWSQPEIQLYGKTHVIPRQHAWYGPQPYTYAGMTLPAEPLPVVLVHVIEQLNSTFCCAFDSVLLNLYQDGHHSMGWYSDNEPELGKDPAVAILSLGAGREIAFRQMTETRTLATLLLTHGSLLFMKPKTQSLFQHAIPKRKKISESRISLTFRRLCF